MVALFAQQSNIIEFPPTAIGQGKSNEWFTPSRYIEAARSVMDSIDLDPASCFEANQTVRASHYYTVRDNGLAQAWKGNTWLNPPFGRVNGSGASKIRMFTTKLVDEYKAGNVKQAILLSTVQTNSTWFQLLWDYSICFMDHRLHFNKLVNGQLEKESRESHMLGTVFVYLGPNNNRFAEVFSEFGPVIPANAAIRRQKVQPLSLWDGGDM